MPKIYPTARTKKAQRSIPGIREGGPTVSSHFNKPKNSSTNRKRKDFGMFHMERNKQPSLPSLSTLLTSDIESPRIDESQSRPKAKKCAKKDIFVGKNLEHYDDEASPIDGATKDRNEFDVSGMFTDGLSDEENIQEEFEHVPNSQDSDTEPRGRRKKEARPGSRTTLGKIETNNFYPRSNPSKNSPIPEGKKMKKSSKTATEISPSGLGPKKKDFGAAAPLHRPVDPLKPRITQNIKIVEPFEAKVGKKASNRILETSERGNSDVEFDTDSVCSSMQSIFSECNIGVVDAQDFSNRPAESSTFGKAEFVDEPTAALDPGINSPPSSSFRQFSVIESQLSNHAEISLHRTEGFKLSPRYAMTPKCRSPIIRRRSAQRDATENSAPVRSPEIDRNSKDTEFFSDSEISNYSEIFSQPSYSYNPLLRVGSQLSGLSKISLPLSEEFKLSPRYSKPRDCRSPIVPGSINTAFDLSQSQYLQQRRSFRRSSRTNDSTTFKFNLSNSVAREISPNDQLALAQSNSNDSFKHRRPSETNVNILNVKINNRVDESFGSDSTLASGKKRWSRSSFHETFHKVQSFVSEWLNQQDARDKNRDGETMTIEENIRTDPESLFANYSCEYTEARLLGRFKPQHY